ncbi:non-specific lipid-transfer protein A-like [Senna tora]|uniref:Non-specific lipid-transfer protein A-like n=1 Tax=Senna tora TaxID=362788 RepID=A0A834SV81_9FABA|nr:non-specific lipid-transfer protein A-like [Senna tora]
MEGVTKSTLLVMLCLALCASSSTSEASHNEISCMQVVQAMSACSDFLSGIGPDIPPLTCCFAANLLTGQTAGSPVERRIVCECFKNLHLSAEGFHRVLRIRQICAVPGLPIADDPNQDCSGMMH